MDFYHVIAVIGIAASPISELRGAIPVAITVFDFPWYYAYLFAVLGNLLPVPVILLFLSGIIPVLSRIGFMNRLIRWFFGMTKKRGALVDKYGPVGLALFVAIPLPITGAWTGSILAVLLGLKVRSAFFAILAGVLAAGVVVTAATLFGWAVAGLFTRG